MKTKLNSFAGDDLPGAFIELKKPVSSRQSPARKSWESWRWSRVARRPRIQQES